MRGSAVVRSRPGRWMPALWGASGLAVALALGLAAGSFAQAAKQGYLGVNLQDLDDELRSSYGLSERDGVLVTGVTGDGPAGKAGVRRGDIILRIGGTTATSASDVTEKVRSMSPGETAVMTLWRDNREVTVRARLGERPVPSERDDGDDRVRVYSWGDGDWEMMDFENMPKPEDFEHLRDVHVMVGGHGRLGVRTQDVEGQFGAYLQAPGGKGVLVTEVMEDTPAAKSGLAAGDIILSVEGKAVSTSSELRRELAGREEGPVRIEVQRRGARQSLTAQLEKPQEMRFFSDGRAPRAYRYWAPRAERRELEREMERLRSEMRELEREMEELRNDLRQD